MTEQPDTDPHRRLDISERSADGIIIVEATGEVDLNTAPELHAAIVLALRAAGDGDCIAVPLHIARHLQPSHRWLAHTP